MFSNYKFDIELSNTSVNIKVFNTITSEIYNGSVNENEAPPFFFFFFFFLIFYFSLLSSSLFFLLLLL